MLSKKPMAVRVTKSVPIRLGVTPMLDKALTRYATSQALSKTGAVSQILINHLRQEKFIK